MRMRHVNFDFVERFLWARLGWNGILCYGGVTSCVVDMKETMCRIFYS